MLELALEAFKAAQFPKNTNIVFLTDISELIMSVQL